MKIALRDIRDGAQIPRFYGSCGYDSNSCWMQVAPIPFNIPIRAARRFWGWLKTGGGKSYIEAQAWQGHDACRTRLYESDTKRLQAEELVRAWKAKAEAMEELLLRTQKIIGGS